MKWYELFPLLTLWIGYFVSVIVITTSLWQQETRKDFPTFASCFGMACLSSVFWPILLILWPIYKLVTRESK